jgi:hypothetical protein
MLKTNLNFTYMKKRIKLSENCVNESLLYFYFSFVVHQLFAKLPQRQKVQNKPLNSLNIERIIEVWRRNCWSEEVEKRTYPTHYHTHTPSTFITNQTLLISITASFSTTKDLFYAHIIPISIYSIQFLYTKDIKILYIYLSLCI